MGNLAIAYAMKKKHKAHGGRVNQMCAHGSTQCEMCHGGEYAKGGEEVSYEKGVHHSNYEGKGKSPAGSFARELHKPMSSIPPHQIKKNAKEEHERILSELRSMKPIPNYAEGGEVEDDMISRIMKKRMGEEPIADFEPNEFDPLEKEPPEEFSYTGENSGDEIGNEAEDEDRDDMISKIMKKRKAQHNPRPA